MSIIVKYHFRFNNILVAGNDNKRKDKVFKKIVVEYDNLILKL